MFRSHYKSGAVKADISGRYARISIDPRKWFMDGFFLLEPEPIACTYIARSLSLKGLAGFYL